MAGRIILRVTPELLASVFAMPRGARVSAVQVEFESDCYLLRIDGEGLPDCVEGCQVQIVHPTYRTVKLSAGEVVADDVDYEKVVSWN